MLIAILDESPLTAQGRPALAPYTGRGDTPSHLGGRVGLRVGAMIYTRCSD